MVHSGVDGRLAGSRPADGDGDDVWVEAFKAGVLEKLNPAEVIPNDLIVHPRWGVGTVTEVGPGRGGGSRLLTVEFPNNGTAMILSDNVMRKRFGGQPR